MRFANQRFEHATIRLDSNEYIGCVFDHCTMEYGASGVVTLGNHIITNCEWRFVDAAARTVNFLRDFYRGGGTEGAKLVDGTFEAIKRP